MQGSFSLRGILDDNASHNTGGDEDVLPAFGNPNELRNPKTHYFPSKPRPRPSGQLPPASATFPGPPTTASDKGKARDMGEEAPRIAPTHRRTESYASYQHDDDEDGDDDGDDDMRSEDGERGDKFDENSSMADSRDDSSLSGAKKRSRTLTTAHQTAVLNALLAKTRFPSTETREEVGAQIGMSARRVQIWFQNRRQSQKRQREKEAADHASSVAAAAQAHHQAQYAHQMHYGQMTGAPQPYGAARPQMYNSRPSFGSRTSFESAHLQERQPLAGYSSRALPEFDDQGRPLSFTSVSSTSSQPRTFPLSASVSSSGAATARPTSVQSNVSRLSGFSKLQLDSPKVRHGAAGFAPAGPMSPSAEPRAAPDILDYAMAAMSRPTRVAPARSMLPGPPLLPMPSGATPRHTTEADAALQAPILPSIASTTFPTRQGPRLPPLRDVFPRASTFSSAATTTTWMTEAASSNADRKPSVGSDWSSRDISSSARTSISDAPITPTLSVPAPLKQPFVSAVPMIPPIESLTSTVNLDKDLAAEWRETSARLQSGPARYSHVRDTDGDDVMSTD